MKQSISIIASLLVGLWGQAEARSSGLAVSSPDQRLTMTVYQQAGQIMYRVDSDGESLVVDSRIELAFTPSGGVVVNPDWSLASRPVSMESIDESWEPVFGKRFNATIFEDAADAHFKANRQAYTRRELDVTSTSKIAARMAPGGGHCMIIEPVK